MTKGNTKLNAKLKRRLEKIRNRKEAANEIYEHYRKMDNGQERMYYWELERDILFNDKKWRKEVDENGENWGVATMPTNW